MAKDGLYGMTESPDQSCPVDLAALQAGDDAAWDVFFAEYDGVIRAVVAWRKWHFAPHDRDDVLQNIRISLVKSLSSLRESDRMRSFVRRISVNRCIDEVRRQVRQREHLTPLGHWNHDGEWEQNDVEADERYDPLRDVLASERAFRLRELLATMDEVCRDAVRQFYMEGITYHEMSKRQGVTVNTIGSRLSRCLEKLRAKVLRVGSV